MSKTGDSIHEQRSVPRWATEPRPDTVDVWRIDATDTALPSIDMFALLNDAERAQANRFKHVEAKRNFITGRACLRTLLARYISAAPETVTLTLNANGKPLLPGGNVAFNLSHSEYVILIAMSGAETIGIDVECHNTALRDRGLYPDVFTADEEQTLIAAESPAAEEELFFRLWTAKEAILKADGRGLSLPAKSFGIDPLDTNEQTVHLADQAHPFTVVSIPIDEGFSAALSYPAGPMHINFLQFPPVWLSDAIDALSNNTQPSIR